MRKKTDTKTRQLKKETVVPSLSAVNVDSKEFKDIIDKAMNDRELEKCLDRFLKENETRVENPRIRDLKLLSSMIGEYLDSYIVFGYDTESERIIIQNYKTARDKDAMMEFLRIVFYKYQNEIDE